jgi:ubiquinone/menaquinone biosynthesis C-methylase UbiE
MSDIRFRASPNFALSLSHDGQAFVAQDCEPYTQYWLDDDERLIFALLMGRQGMTHRQLAEAFDRMARRVLGRSAPRDLDRIFDDMRRLGLILAASEDTSRYTDRIVEAYLAHRPFPSALARHLIERADIAPHTRVLDVAGGPGDLAVQLAAASDEVTLMELSGGFLDAARRRAEQFGRNLETVHDSGNRLMHRDGVYDVITIAQALHWMDDIQFCRGIGRTLADHGHLFVIHSAVTMDDAHPLSFLLGNNSILGAKSPTPFPKVTKALAQRLTQVFAALEQPRDRPAAAVTRPVEIRLFQQPRPLGMGFARAFMTERHIEATGQSPEAFWSDLTQRLDGVDPADLMGTLDWAVLQFRRGAADTGTALPDIAAATEIDYQPGTPPDRRTIDLSAVRLAHAS